MDKLLLIAGVALLMFAAYQFVQMRSFLADSVQATATVVEVIKRSVDSDDGQSSDSYHYLLEFDTHSGESISFESEVASAEKLHQIGDQMPLLYKTNNPQNAKINLFWTTWGKSLTFAVAGLTLVVLGWIKL